MFPFVTGPPPPPTQSNLNEKSTQQEEQPGNRNTRRVLLVSHTLSQLCTEGAINKQSDLFMIPRRRSFLGHAEMD